MRAAIFEKQGLDNLFVKDDVQQPTITDYDVLIKVKAAGVNPTGDAQPTLNHVRRYASVLIVQKKQTPES